jgi:thioredoxin-like negative regulator of GroEL
MRFSEVKARAGTTVILLTGHKCPACDALKPVLSAVCEREGIEMTIMQVQDEIDACRALGMRMVPTVVLAGAGQAEVLFSGVRGEPSIMQSFRMKGLVD